MIKIKVEYDNNFISKIVITGHANYDDYGKDIICAAVSASVLTTINGIIALDNSILEYNLQYINEEWYKLLELKYKFKKNETQISLEMNISQSQVNKIKQKAIADIRRWEEWRKVE